jgi:tetratricopeptide (TPR) repeat protein
LERYNRGTLIRYGRAVVVAVLVVVAGVCATAQSQPAAVAAAGTRADSSTLLVLPFENTSAVPGIEWIGEAIPEVIGSRLSDEGVYVISREDRLRAYDRFGIPLTLRPPRATLYRIAEEMDADFAVFGRYAFDGQTFTASAQLLNVKQRRLSKEFTERGPLPSVMEVSNGLAWAALHDLNPDAGREPFMAASPTVRLDALENYIRGITAGARLEQVRRLKEALRISPDYQRARYQLGRTYFEMRDYSNAIANLTKLKPDTAEAREGMFYAALSAWYQGDYARAEEWFGELASRMPLTEVYNNLAIAQLRLGKNTALQNFERAAQRDPNDPDYHYNYGLALYRFGDSSGAVRQLREALALKPSDAEAKTMLEAASSGTANPSKSSQSAPERLKRNYDETAFRQAAVEVERAGEAAMANADPITHARYHLERGRELLNEGVVSEAEKNFREACKLQPQDPAAHAALATVLEREGDLKNARVEAEAANRGAGSVEAFVVLTRLDMRSGDLTSAANDVQHALSLQPNNAAALMLEREIKARRTASQKPGQN